MIIISDPYTKAELLQSLDKFMLPHPLLGKLAVREMLFFTMYHNLHHVNNVRRQRGHELITV